MKLELVPLSLQEANEFVRAHHRHNAPVPGAKFVVGCSINGSIVGVAIAGRPVARMLLISKRPCRATHRSVEE